MTGRGADTAGHTDKAGDYAAAERDFGEAAEWHERAARLNGEERPSTAALQMRARLAEARDDRPTARRLFGQLERLRRRQADETPDDIEAQVAWLTSLDQVGDLAVAEDDRAEAVEAYERALRAAEGLVARAPDEVLIRQALSNFACDGDEGDGGADDVPLVLPGPVPRASPAPAASAVEVVGVDGSAQV